MTMYDRSTPATAQVVGEFDDGLSWIAHPDEDGQRASHALQTEEGVWILDPLDAPNVDELVEPLGDVVGVAVLTCWHARDAGEVARRHDVAVHIPEWMDRIEERVNAPIERYTLAPGGPESEFAILPCRPLPGWQEVFLYHEPSKTLVIPDSLGTTPQNLVDGERLGLAALRRLQPPNQLRGLEPDRVLVGHGEPVLEDTTDALETALRGARRSFPRAILDHGPESVRSILAALR